MFLAHSSRDLEERTDYHDTKRAANERLRSRFLGTVATTNLPEGVAVVCTLCHTQELAQGACKFE